MAKFPTEAEKSITVKAPLARVYKFLSDVLGSVNCTPGVDSCKRVGNDTYRFVYREVNAGPVSHVARYTARYDGNGTDRITFSSIPSKDGNTDVTGFFRLQASGPETTKITLRQAAAADSPVPRLLQGFVRSFVERNAADLVKQHLVNIKCALEEE
ncbi:MAG: SRPBCC family protein [Candidatus Binatia bacterium]